jgi:DnaD and phage-associated domain
MDTLELQGELLSKVVQKGGGTVFPNILIDAYLDLNLTNDELPILLHIMRAQNSPEGITLKSVDYLALKTRRPISEVERALKALEKKGVIRLPKGIASALPQAISLDSLYGMLLGWTKTSSDIATNNPADDEIAKLYQYFESFFGHVNAAEYETMRKWIFEDHWAPAVLAEALQIAALSRKRSLRYIAAILKNWKRQNITTVEQVRHNQNLFDAMKFQLANQAAAEKAKAEARRNAPRQGSRPKSAKRPNFMEQGDETPEERKKKYERLIE